MIWKWIPLNLDIPVYLLENLCAPPRFEDWCPAAFWEVNTGLQTEPKFSPMMDPNICRWRGPTTGCPCPSHSGPASHLTVSGTWAAARKWGAPWENLLLLREWSLWSLGVGSVILGWAKWEAFGSACFSAPVYSVQYQAKGFSNIMFNDLVCMSQSSLCQQK